MASNSETSGAVDKLSEKVEKELEAYYELAKAAFEAEKKQQGNTMEGIASHDRISTVAKHDVKGTEEGTTATASHVQPTISLLDKLEKPLKKMSQQEKVTLKAAFEGTQGSAVATKAADKSENEVKKGGQFLRPVTPPNQTGVKFKDEEGLSPCSQAVTSGTVTPTYEGIKRVDRDVQHAPPGGLDLW